LRRKNLEHNMQDSFASRRLAVVTGASSGIGYHLARCAVERGYDLVVAADKPRMTRCWI
jgi:short-subunit dehydrogenase